mmetsp:Transcript_6621/g.16064  ORF Transcript_6621/g.16064 Transcript_6621/m.16064 type:complete len:176 (-) Transcript_6621:1500-2027(-)
MKYITRITRRIFLNAKSFHRSGNCCMISIPSVWDPALAPPGHHVAHVYTLEPFHGWTRADPAAYRAKKLERAQPLLAALRKVIPDIDERIRVQRVASPLTHAKFLRRHKGTYGPAIVAGKATFPGPNTGVKNLYRVGDSVLPGIGVPAVAASGMIVANSLVSSKKVDELVEKLGY